MVCLFNVGLLLMARLGTEGKRRRRIRPALIPVVMLRVEGGFLRSSDGEDLLIYHYDFNDFVL